MGLKKVQKQGRDERTQEDYPTSGVYFRRCWVVFLRSFISALFLSFFQAHPQLINKKYYVTGMGNFNLTHETMCVESIKRHQLSVFSIYVYNCYCVVCLDCVLSLST